MTQIYQLVLRVALFWVSVNVVHVVLSRLLAHRYNFFLSRNGIFVKFVTIQWHTKRFNYSLVQEFNRTTVSFLKGWFICGAYFGVVAMVMSVLILAYTLASTFVSSSSQETQIMTPVIPGVNLPANQVVPYLLTLLLSGVFHEFGHALAASLQGVSMYGSGIFLFLIYPAAFVELNTERLGKCRATHRLRIFCAGVWHNVVMMVAGYALWCLLPGFLVCLGFVRLPTSVLVRAVEPGSAMASQITYGSQITALNDCIVTNKETWGGCLERIASNPPVGYCITDHVMDHVQSGADCCRKDTTSAKGVCFTSGVRDTCLVARTVAKQATCLGQGHCSSGTCYTPRSDEGHLLTMTDSKKDLYLFIGDPIHLYLSIDVSDYRSNIFWSGLPEALELFFVYIISLSGALAIFNAVPAFYLDGQHILDSTIEVFLTNTRTEIRNKVSYVIQIFSTILVALNVINAIFMVCRLY